MKKSKTLTDLAKLELYNLAITNAKKEPQISESLNQIGISADVLEEGRNIYSIADNAYRESNASKKKRLETYDLFVKKSEALEELFMVDRKKTMIALLKDKLAQQKLGLNLSVPQNRLKRFDRAMTFYTALSENPELVEPLAKFGLNQETIAARLEIVSDVEKTRADYMIEKAVSQNATLLKNESIDTLSKWMSQFFAIAKNALKEQPQMMEALGYVVKN